MRKITWVQALILVMAPPAFGQEALVKLGSCPSGYTTSGKYCVQGKNARPAVQKVGSCPSGYTTSGDYCLMGANGKHAVPKIGSCPSGYTTSGSYCLANN